MKKQWAGVLFIVKCCCLCENHRRKGIRRKKEKPVDHLATFRFDTFAMLFPATYVGVLMVMKILEDDPCIVTKAYMFTTFEIIFVSALNHLDSSHTHSLKVFKQVGQAS